MFSLFFKRNLETMVEAVLWCGGVIQVGASLCACVCGIVMPFGAVVGAGRKPLQQVRLSPVHKAAQSWLGAFHASGSKTSSSCPTSSIWHAWESEAS